MAVASSSATPGIVTQFEIATRRLIAWRLLPLLFILYIINYIDRTNIAYAALGMSRDLGFSDRVFGLGAGIFFVSYVALQIPGALLVERWSARRVISATLIAWGALTVLTAQAHTPNQLYVARFALGAAEAGFFPGVIVYLSHWFIQKDRAKALSNFMGAIPLSSVLGAPLAGWVLGQAWLGVQGWRWLFIVEGMPAILLGVLAFFVLTDWPREATWLTREQREWVQQELKRENTAGTKAITAWQALSCRRILLLASIPFFSYFAIYCFQFWFPIILKRQSGFSDFRVGLIGALPFVAYFLAMQFNGWHSDKTRERRWHSAALLFTASVALLTFLLLRHSVASLIVSFTAVGIGAAYLPTFWAIPTETLNKSSAATAVGLINAVGSISGFAGPYSFGSLYARTGSFSAGVALMMIAALAAGLLILCTPPPGPPAIAQARPQNEGSLRGALLSVDADELV